MNLENTQKKLMIQRKRNERLEDELAKNLVESEHLFESIKVEDEKVQLVHRHEEMQKRKKKKSIFVEDYQKSEEEKEKTTTIVAAQIFTKTKELSEDEKKKLINDSSETETVGGIGFDESVYQEAKQMKMRLDSEMRKGRESNHQPPDYDPYNDSKGGK